MLLIFQNVPFTIPQLLLSVNEEKVQSVKSNGPLVRTRCAGPISLKPSELKKLHGLIICEYRGRSILDFCSPRFILLVCGYDSHQIVHFSTTRVEASNLVYHLIFHPIL